MNFSLELLQSVLGKGWFIESLCYKKEDIKCMQKQNCSNN